MLSLILSCIRNLTISFPGLPAADLRFIAAGLLGLATENGTMAAPLAAIAAELDQPADRVLAVLRALASAGLVVLQVPPLVGDVAETWVVCWWAGFAGAGVTVNVYSDAAENGGGLSHAGARAVAGGCLFVCSDPENNSSDLDIYKNKQTNSAGALARACEGDGADGGDAGRIVALLTDPAVTAGLLVKGSGAPVGAFTVEKAREIAGVVLRAGGSFDAVLANVCQWRRQIEAGELWSPRKALETRLGLNGRPMFEGHITAADRALPWFAAHVPDAWALPFPAGVTVNVYSEPAENGAAVEAETAAGSVNVYSCGAPAEAPAVSWLAGLAGAGQVAALLADAEATPDENGDGWIVRVGQAGRGWAAWLQAKGARPVGRALAAWAGLGAQPVPVRFVEGGAVFGD